MLLSMSEPTSTSDAATGPVTPALPPEPPHVTESTPPPPYRQNRLNQVAAWVGIVAGVVFIVAVVFGTGFMVGKHTGRGGFGPGHGPVMFHREGPPPFPMGPRGQSERGPGAIFPGGPDFQPPQPPQSPGAPTTTAPARP
jgi:hypothetical protein